MIDSLIWKEYLEKGNTKEAEILEKLVKEDKAIIYGYTFAEILKGSICSREIFLILKWQFSYQLPRKSWAKPPIFSLHDS